MNRVGISLLVLLLSLPIQAAADDESSYHIFGQTTSYLELNQPDTGDSDEDYTKFKQMLSFNLGISAWTFGAQVEYLDYSHPERVDHLDLDRVHDTWELRKYYVDFSSEHFSARLGTFFSSLGRGLTLYVQKNESLGFDEPIHGVTATATFENVDLTVLAGDVTEPVLQAQYDRDFKDSIRGGRVLFRLPHDIHFGGSASHAELERFFPEGTDIVDVWAIEGGADGIAGRMDVHGEWAELDRKDSSGSIEGHGGYFSASSYFGPLTVLVEYKDYWNFRYRYNLPPNAGRSIESYDHDDVKGPRVLLSADIMSLGAVLYGSYARFDTHKKESSLGGREGDQQNEWYVALEESAGPVYLESSYFNRRWLDRDLEQEHIIADLHYTLGAKDELILSYDKRLEAASYFSLVTHRSSLSYSLSPHGVLSLRYSWEEKSGRDNEDFWGINLEYLPSQAITLSLFGGSDPGGMVCSGGQCRVEPVFKGYKGSFTWRF